MKEHWKYLGVEVPQHMHPTVDGKRCYHFRLEHIGIGATNRLIPIDTFWGRS